jgi:hypothetical protein
MYSLVSFLYLTPNHSLEKSEVKNLSQIVYFTLITKSSFLIPAFSASFEIKIASLFF